MLFQVLAASARGDSKQFLFHSSSSFYCSYCNSNFSCALFSFPFIYLLSPWLAFTSLFLSACTGFYNVNEWIRMCNLFTWNRASIRISHRFLSSSDTRFRSFQRSTSISIALPVHGKWGEADDDSVLYANAFRQYYFYFLHFRIEISLWVGRGGWDAAQRLIQKQAKTRNSLIIKYVLVSNGLATSGCIKLCYFLAIGWVTHALDETQSNGNTTYAPRNGRPTMRT